MALIFLVLLTLLGVSAMQTATMEERMAGNMRNENLAFQAAEAALRDAEDLLGGAAPPTTFNGTGGLYDTSWQVHGPVVTTPAAGLAGRPRMLPI